MKKNLYLVLISILSVFVITSCSNDDDKIIDNSWLYGKWNVTHFSSSENGTYFDIAGNEAFAEFNSDGTYNSHFESTYSGVYTIDGKRIKALVNNETVVYDILERNGNNAKASMYYESQPNIIMYFKLLKE